MKREEHIGRLLEAAEENGIVATLHELLGKGVRVRVPFGRKACEASVDDVEFSPRAEHALKRSGVFKIGEVIDLIADDGLLRIRNLGKKTQNEIKTRILAFGYAQLSTAEKRRFFYDVLEKNCTRI